MHCYGSLTVVRKTKARLLWLDQTQDVRTLKMALSTKVFNKEVNILPY